VTPSQPPATRNAPAEGRPPRNYLARAEHRRIFWLFMPPALAAMLLLGWLERAWLSSPTPPAAPQVDTRVADPVVAVADAVTIEAEQPPPEGPPEELGASLLSLSRVRDDTMFRAADEDAWFQIWARLRGTDMPTLLGKPARRVGFTELFGQPQSFRGRLVRIRGTLHRLEKLDAPANNYDVTAYWQGWLEPEGGPASPVVVYFLRLPAGMPEGMKIRERVDVVGYFFKRWAYAATDAVRTAPLILALEPSWKPRTPAGGGIGTTTISTIALVAMGGLVLLTALGIRSAGRGVARPPEPPPADLAATLSDIEPCSPDEALRRLAAADRGAEQAPQEPVR